MTHRFSPVLRSATRITTAGLLAVLFVSQSVFGAPTPTYAQRRVPDLAPPQQEARTPQARALQARTVEKDARALKKQSMIRPTRPAKLEPSQPVVGSEAFVERFDDGSIKVEREVTLDSEGNYVNHGPWRMWNKAGQMVAEGSYDHGQRTSIWTRWYDRNDSPILNQAPFRGFKPPFLSQTNFENGVMEGEWSIFDAEQRRCCQISITHGKRNGISLFWQPDGTVLQQSEFEMGVPSGDVLQLDNGTGKLTHAKNFLNGRERITKKNTFNRSRQQKFEGNFLAPISVQTAADDFWTLQFAKYEPKGEELRHGQWQEWYSNGQLKMSGEYRQDAKVGQFSYWHPNGQKAAEGSYVADKHDGTWVWWHANGQKSTTGKFKDGMLVDQWRWWAENGRLTGEMMHDGTKTFESLAGETLDVDSQIDNKSARTGGRVQR